MFRIAFPTQLGNTRLRAAMRLFACCAVAACTTGAKADDHCPVCTAAVKAAQIPGFSPPKVRVAMRWCVATGTPIFQTPLCWII